MKLSIMITTYNCVDSVDITLSSVFKQNIPFSWELLIGDDGSSDGTMDRLVQWQKKHPEMITIFSMTRKDSNEKSGTRAARNRANLLEHASGQYLYFLDGDDWLLGNNKFIEQISMLDEDKYKSCSCSAHNMIANIIGENKKYAMTDESFETCVVEQKQYWKSMYYSTNTIVFRNCCKETMLLPQYRDYLNDNFITYIILQYGKILYIAGIWAQYNITGTGIWTGNNRVYGSFRNLTIYDLEMQINSSFKKESFIRHLCDFTYIFKNYHIKNNDVDLLVNSCEKNRFKYTWIMYRIGRDQSIIDIIKKSILFIHVYTVSLEMHINNLLSDEH